MTKQLALDGLADATDLDYCFVAVCRHGNKVAFHVASDSDAAHESIIEWQREGFKVHVETDPVVARCQECREAEVG